MLYGEFGINQLERKITKYEFLAVYLSGRTPFTNAYNSSDDIINNIDFSDDKELEEWDMDYLIVANIRTKDALKLLRLRAYALLHDKKSFDNELNTLCGANSECRLNLLAAVDEFGSKISDIVTF